MKNKNKSYLTTVDATLHSDLDCGYETRDGEDYLVIQKVTVRAVIKE